MTRKITPLHYKDLIKIFQKFGLAIIRTKGDHIIMSKLGMKRPVVIQAKKSVSVGHILNNIKEANISREEFLEALK